ncbi:MAG: M50 family metallopeptidase [Anaerolineae bacterium]|nr:M50 family metallopeptidase [Phycisphaerae bacterium]
MAQTTSQPLGRGSFRLFSLAGINVYLHWSWLVVAFIQIRRNTGYSSPAWALAEYLVLFLIVLLHEFGHAFACRSVGGRADRIVLWPLGGVAFVQPPQRPGAMLWSIVAGPLVNVALIPVTIALYVLVGRLSSNPDIERFLYYVGLMNAGLLIFNMLPIYPLDGGQIVRSLLWFVVGQARSLMIASVIGIVCSSATIVLLLAFRIFDVWLLVIAGFAIMQSWMGVRQARQLSAVLALPRHSVRHCPSCRQSPPAVPMWGCRCGNGVDVFAADGICPHCGTRFELVPCPFFGVVSPLHAWTGPSPAPPVMPLPGPAVATVSPATRTQA